MTPTTIDVLNELLSAEQRNLVASLMESTMFVSRLSMHAHDLLEQMADSSAENCRWLVDCITARGGVPGLRSVTMAPADLHFQELHVALPRLLADRRALIAKYERAQQQLRDPDAAALIGRILDRHRAEEQALNDLPVASTQAS